MEQYNPLLPTPPEPSNTWTRPLGLAVERLVRFLKGLQRDGDSFVFNLPVTVPAFVSSRYITHPANGCVADGVTDNSAALAALASGHYYVPAGTFKVSTAGTTTIPAGVTLEFEKGALFDTGATSTLVFAGGIVAGAFQVFRHTAGVSASDVRFTGTGREVRASWWGVVGDGATDCTYAMRAFGTSLILASGANRLLVDVVGTVVSDTLAIFYTGARIHGLGKGLTTLKRKAGFSHLTPFLANVNEAVAADGCELAHLTIDGNRANVVGSASGDGNAMGFRVVGFTNLSVHHVSITGCWTDGLYIGKGTAATQNVHVSECEITNCRRNNISVVHCTGGSVTRCRLTSATGTAPQCGLDVEPLTGETVSDFLIADNYFGSCTGDGISIFGGVGGTLTRITVKGNHCVSNTGHGIKLTLSATVSTGKIDVTGNVCSLNGGDGIQVLATSTTSYDYNLILGNRCESNTGNGIRIEHSAWNLVSGNRCTSNGAAGIFVTGDTAEGNTLVGNTCMLNTTQGIYLFSTSKYNGVVGNTSMQNQNYGILFSTGVTDCKVVGNTVAENSQQTDVTYDGIALTTNCDRNLIQGNSSRRGALAKKQRWGFSIATSDCDANVVGQNDFYDGGSTGYARDLGTGTIVQVQEGLTADAGDADYTYTPWSNPASVIYATTRTASRSATFLNAGALKGMRGRVAVRSGGLFDVLVKDNGGTTLTALNGTGKSAEVVFNGSAWVLVSTGGQQAVSFATALKWGNA